MRQDKQDKNDGPATDGPHADFLRANDTGGVRVTTTEEGGAIVSGILMGTDAFMKARTRRENGEGQRRETLGARSGTYTGQADGDVDSN